MLPSTFANGFSVTGSVRPLTTTGRNRRCYALVDDSNVSPRASLRPRCVKVVVNHLASHLPPTWAHHASRIVAPDAIRGFYQCKGQKHRSPVHCQTADTADAATADTVEPSSVSEGEEMPYNWFKQWYPVAPLATLNPSRPNATELLGQRLVLWKDATGEWRCFQDRCPHRLAPLSEGRIESGRIMCSYHGWEFEGDGSCSRIPQADSSVAEATATASQRSCVEHHPVRVHHGLLFVWGEAGAVAQIEASAKPVPVVPELDDPEAGPKYTFVSNWFTCLLPYGYDTLIENVIDPSHVPFSHHGKQGNRKDGKAIPMVLSGEISRENGFVVHTGSPDPSFSDDKRKALEKVAKSDRFITFVPPSMLHYRFGRTDDGLVRFNLMAYAIPVRPGVSRIVFSTFTGMKSPIFKLLSLKPTWLDHIERMDVLSGDGVFLHAQERELRRGGLSPDSYSKNFFMPMTCDSGVLAFRKWFHTMAGGCVNYANGATDRELPPLVNDRTVLLDRWDSHSKDCPACSAAHRNLNYAKVAALAIAAGLFLALAASLGHGPSANTVTLLWGHLTVLKSTMSNAVLGAATLAFVFFAKKAQDLQQKLVFEDYIHAEKN